MTDFDHVPNRRDRNVVNKWTYYDPDILPMWVADMDFPAPPAVLRELHAMINQGVLGYELTSDALKQTVAARMDYLYRWKLKPESVVAVPGIVSAFTVAARAFPAARKGVVLQTPVYNEFHQLKKNVGIPQINAPLAKRVEGNILKYEIDWDVFEARVKNAGIFLLCNPHNPLGIIFSRKELLRMAELCLKHRVLIVSDEIHSELLLDDHTFTPIAALSREIAERTITLVAPSKTYNVPGLFCGFALIPNKALRERYVREVEHLRLHVSSAGLHAARIGFSGQCDAWLRELRRYLSKNRDYLIEYVTQRMPGVRVTNPQATYLAWIDFTQLHLPDSPFEYFKQRAKVAVSDGKIFGAEGRGFARLNFGTSRNILKLGLDRMRAAITRK